MDKKNEISRHEFVKIVGAGAAIVAGTALVPPLSAQTKTPVPGSTKPAPGKLPRKWDLTADVVIIGAGAVGLPAAIKAADAGASVIVIDTNYDIGGHAITSGGNVPLGGGTSFQKKYGIVDSADTVFKDLTDWSVVEVNGMPEYRYNDPAVQRALADNMAPTFEFLLANGVGFEDKAPDNSGGHAIGISAKREHHCVWTKGQSAESPAGAGGTKLMRGLEDSARKKGVKFLLNYHMDTIFREKLDSGRVVGLQARYTPTILPGSTSPLKSFRSDGNIDLSAKSVTIKAKKAIVIGTGGSTGNVSFRRMFDARLTEEYALAADEYSPQDGSGELAAMAIGATLWGTANQTFERNGYLRKRPIIGTRTNYIGWTPASPLFPKVGASGLNVRNWQDAIIVNQAGKRFYNEMDDGYPNGTTEGFFKEGYVHGDWRNAQKITYKPKNYIDAALAMNEGSVAPEYSAGPQWAIFDAEAVNREKWVIDGKTVHPDYFFSAPTLAELAAKISACPYQKARMSGEILQATVKEYNSMVDAGADTAFDKPSPKYKIENGPFYAAWATFAVHDTYAGLRINMKGQVMDMDGQVIQSLYSGGESAGGCSQHGLGRSLTQGFIAGKEAASEK
ncbi:MAG: tat (twin-arginine translocation) pathway signal sequence [Spirochaetae bacterium HGW-Spirochaetae-7]|nr:MAG: tat (twin-arginine translocation) pathway signal sequence [Spirochaetae bacterium HGW-Spirochaetae-7]